jgi:hypothetical protein
MPFLGKYLKVMKKKFFLKTNAGSLFWLLIYAPITIKLVRKDAYVMDESRFFLHTIRDRHFKKSTNDREGEPDQIFFLMQLSVQ